MGLCKNGNLFALFQSRYPDDLSQPFLQGLDGNALSYEALEAGSAGMAGALRHLGASPGDRVMVQVEKSPEAVILYLACLRAGLIFVPLNTAYTKAELSYFIEDAEPSILVCRPGTSMVHEVSRTLTLGADGHGHVDGCPDRVRALCRRGRTAGR